ncbi:MAG TPA: PQ-loop repeat-containing protein [Burkholderiales bacterium]
MFEGTQWIGFAGTALVIIAYVPQIHHLIAERCSGGISIKAYTLWLVAGMLMLVHAVAIADPVFMALQGYQIGAGALVIFFGLKYKGSVCEAHRHAA